MCWHAFPRAQATGPTHFDVKAAYLLNFGRFTTWPATVTSETDDFPVCVLGRDPFGESLDAIVAGESLNGKKAVVKRMAVPQRAAGCRIVFVSVSKSAELDGILEALVGLQALTVSDVPEFLDRGGMIQFVSEGKRIRFAVNLPAATRAGLTLSSALLRVAAAVKTSTKPGA
jgi:hypothetical protein